MAANFNGFFAFVGGAIVGLTASLLLAPAKGDVTRMRIKRALRERGLFLNESQVDEIMSRAESSAGVHELPE